MGGSEAPPLFPGSIIMNPTFATSDGPGPVRPTQDEGLCEGIF